MDKLDRAIAQALSAEDQALLAEHAEAGYINQALGMFRGPWSWVLWVVNIAGGVAFLAGLYAFWQVYHASEVLAAVKWSALGLVLFQVTVIGKSFMGAHLEGNRMLREIKRVELQLSLLRTQS